MNDYITELRHDLVEAAARQQAAGRGARIARPVRPRAWSPAVILGTAAALAAAIVLVAGLRAVSPPRPPEALKVVGGFHIEAQPRDAVAAGGYVFVADYGGQLLQIDPRTEERRQIETTAGNALPAAVADDGGALWAVTVDARPARPRSILLKLDPRSGRRLDSIRLAGEGGALAIGAGGIWLQTNRTSPYPSAPPLGLDRIDPVTHRRTAAIRGAASQSIAASDHSLWTREGGAVTQRDDAGRVVNRVGHISPALGLEDQRSIVADSDGAWLVGQTDGLLYRIERGQVVRRLRVGVQAGVIARTHSAVWVTAGRDGQYELVRVDADAGKVTGRVRLGGDMPQTIVPIGKQVWVITADGTVTRVNQG
jgi:hypothetical protein